MRKTILSTAFAVISVLAFGQQAITFDPVTMKFDQDFFNTFNAGEVTVTFPADVAISFDGAFTAVTIPKGVNLTLAGASEQSKTKLVVPTFSFAEDTEKASKTSLKLKNLEMTPYGYENNGATTYNLYLINQSKLADISLVELDNCYMHDFTNCLFRLQGTAPNIMTVERLRINNCVFKAMGTAYDFIVTSGGGHVLKNIEFTNSTFYSTVGRSFISLHADTPDTESIKIENATFYNFLASGKYFIDHSANKKSAALTINNVILGKTSNVASKGIRQATGAAPMITNVFTAADFVLGSNAVSDITPLDQASADLFVDPDNGNFTLKAGVMGDVSNAGDPTRNRGDVINSIQESQSSVLYSLTQEGIQIVGASIDTQLFNANGQLVGRSTESFVRTATLPAGIYMFRIQADGQTVTGKLVK